MTDLDDAAVPLDGRVARRQRNIDAVVDVVLEMFGEDAMFPTIEQAATRSGLSLRSLYRYFADPGALLEAAVRRSDQIGMELAHLPAIGEGALTKRVDDFVAMRIRFLEELGPIYRATMANAARLPRIADELERNRDRMRDQFALQFAQELEGLGAERREATLAAGDLLTQPESIIYLRRYRNLSVEETRRALTTGLLALLD